MKKVFSVLLNDFKTIKNPLLIFSIVYFINSVSVYFVPKLMKFTQTHNIVMEIISLLILLVNLLIYPINQYLFQRKYSEIKKLELNVNRFSKYLTKLVGIYIIQILFLGLITLLLSFIVLTVIGMIKNIDEYKVVVVTLVVLLFVGIWFVRLIFISNILVYKRKTYISGEIIEESKYLVKKNLPFFIVFILFPYIITSIIIILSYPNIEYPSQNVYIIIFNLLFQVIVSIGCSAITINEIISNPTFITSMEKKES